MIAYFTEMFGPAFGPVIGLAVVLILLALGIWVLFMVIRRFRSGLFISGAKSRAPRLAVTDAVPVDSHRRLILVRRDDVEHLIMIGGPIDIVVEAGIGRPQPAIQHGAPRIQPQITEPQVKPQAIIQPASPPAIAPAAPQRSANMAAREAVTEAERGRPIRTPETQLPERRVEPFMASPAAPTPPMPPAPQGQGFVQGSGQGSGHISGHVSGLASVQAAAQTAPLAVSPAAVPVTPPSLTRAALDADLDKLLDELRPNPLQDR